MGHSPVKHCGDSQFLLFLSLILADSQIPLGSFSVDVGPSPLGMTTYEVLVPSELLAVYTSNKEAKTPVVAHLLDLLRSSPKRNLLEMRVGNRDALPSVVSFGSLLS